MLLYVLLYMLLRSDELNFQDRRHCAGAHKPAFVCSICGSTAVLLLLPCGLLQCCTLRSPPLQLRLRRLQRRFGARQPRLGGGQLHLALRQRLPQAGGLLCHFLDAPLGIIDFPPVM